MASIKAPTWSALLAKRKGGGRLHPPSKLVCLRKASSGMMAVVAGILLPRFRVEDTENGSLQVVPVREKHLSELCEVTVVSHKPKFSPESRMPREGLQLQSTDSEEASFYMWIIFFNFWSSPVTSDLDRGFVSINFYVTYFFKELTVHLCQIETWALAPLN